MPARLLRWLREGRARHRLRAGARRAIAELFASPARLRGTSLRLDQRGRAVLLDLESDGPRLTAVAFGIVRHPRPHAFSRYAHEVLELWRIDLVAGGPPERLRGVNLTRQREKESGRG
jgi:hypothetical protein